ncbi:hypothetical protein MIND_00619100 [Mycena indigotica]|uniref:Uncharacterized protein n=1 Tax=Mycena indigotica TaxID=2126181 RepID=A0A8H6SQ14_9AGAR|nr:uncharacterized protein MIND_00619100 [Mycena indigotica]KAF7303890.1 hypothetical protein MIND_00619100 [Mycena indigotica]
MCPISLPSAAPIPLLQRPASSLPSALARHRKFTKHAAGTPIKSPKPHRRSMQRESNDRHGAIQPYRSQHTRALPMELFVIAAAALDDDTTLEVDLLEEEGPTISSTQSLFAITNELIPILVAVSIVVSLTVCIEVELIRLKFAVSCLIHHLFFCLKISVATPIFIFYFYHPLIVAVIKSSIITASKLLTADLIIHVHSSQPQHFSTNICAMARIELFLAGSTDTGFAHNIGGIIGVAIGGLIAVILGVLIVFAACGRYRKRRTQPIPSPQMYQRRVGGWRAPLAGEEDSVNEAENSSDSVGHTSSSGHMAFSYAGAALASNTEPGFWYGGGGSSSQGHSSQSHPHTEGFSSTQSHGPLLPASTSSNIGHSSTGHTSSSSSSSRPALASPPPSFSASHSNKLFGRLRGPKGSPALVDVPPLPSQTIPLPPSPRFVPPAAYDPLAVPARSSLLNPPLPVIDLTPPATVPPNWQSGWHSAASSRPLASRTLTDDSEMATAAPEGLLRPGLLLPTQSTGTLRDHVDYSRPLALHRPGFGVRMDTSNTYASTISVDGHEDDKESIGIAT